MDEPSPATTMLGANITRNRPQRSLKITQTKAIKALQNKLNYELSGGAPTPMRSDFIPRKSDCPDYKDTDLAARQSEYRSFLMSLVWIARWSMPQISYAVSKLGKFIANPGEVHMVALKRLLRYVFANADAGMSFPAEQTPSTKLYGHCDSSHADDVDTRRSTLGTVFFYAGCAVSWSSRLHSYVTTSTNHTEYCALGKAAREAKYLHSIFTFIGREQDVSPIVLFCDNSGAVTLSHNAVDQTKTKHVDISEHYTRELVEAGVIETKHISKKEMIADLFTKALDTAKFRHFTKRLIGS